MAGYLVVFDAQEIVRMAGPMGTVGVVGLHGFGMVVVLVGVAFAELDSVRALSYFPHGS